MNAEQIERFNELAQVALDGEMRFQQIVKMLKAGQREVAKTHLEQAHNVIHRLECELKRS